MTTLNNKFEVELENGDIVVFHPETNTGQIYDFTNEKWLEFTIGDLNNLTTSQKNSIVEAINSHAQNQQIHVTQAKQDKWDKSFIAKSGEFIGGNIDFNNLEPNKAYQVGEVENALNKPPASWGVLIYYKPEVTYAIQEFTTMIGDIKYTRRYDLGAGGWTAWKQVTFDQFTYDGWNAGFDAYTRFQGDCQAITDWNLATKNGMYMGAGTANAPSEEWYMGVVIAHNDSWVVQKVIQFTGDREFERWKRNGTWGAWVETSPMKLFQSVSNGKSLIANAITGKGIWTSPTAEFATMASNISQINTGLRLVLGTGTTVRTGSYDNTFRITGLGNGIPRVIVIEMPYPNTASALRGTIVVCTNGYSPAGLSGNYAEAHIYSGVMGWTNFSPSVIVNNGEFTVSYTDTTSNFSAVGGYFRYTALLY